MNHISFIDVFQSDFPFWIPRSGVSCTIERNGILNPRGLAPWRSEAIHLLNNGAPIDVIQSLLGHEKGEATRIYAQLSGEIRQEFYNKYF